MNLQAITPHKTNGQDSLTIRSKMPNWTMIPTSSSTHKSEEDFRKEIKALAEKMAGAKSKQEQESLNYQKQKLSVEYVSVVSPDRKTLYKQAEKSISSISSGVTNRCSGIGEVSLLDFLEQAEGRTKNLAEKIVSFAGGTMSFTMLTGGGYGVYISSQGKNLLSNSGNGWCYEPTDEEVKRSVQFANIFRNEYEIVQKAQDGAVRDIPEYLDEKPRFDMKA